VWRVDNETLEVKAVPVENPSGIAITPPGVWVADGLGGVLTLLSLDGGSLLDTVEVGAKGNQIANLAVGAGAVWMVDGAGGRIIRVDLTTHDVVARIAVGPSPEDIAADDQGVWVTN
jgi:DNA-binding beta-propeller fold protein YncE